MYFVNQTSKYNNPFRDGCFDSRYNALKIHNLLTTRRSHSEFYQPCKNDEILKYILALIICKIKALYYIQLYGFATPKNLYATYSILLLHCNWKFTYTYKSVIRDSKFFAGFSAHQEFFRFFSNIKPRYLLQLSTIAKVHNVSIYLRVTFTVKNLLYCVVILNWYYVKDVCDLQ